MGTPPSACVVLSQWLRDAIGHCATAFLLQATPEWLRSTGDPWVRSG